MSQNSLVLPIAKKQTNNSFYKDDHPTMSQYNTTNFTQE
jgi:hypothetical protein